MTNAQHSSENSRWFTPKWLTDAAEEVLGPIDLDPASEPEANKRIGAARYYTAEQDGLSNKWSGTIWLNPPGGKVENKSLPLLFWQRLMETRDGGWLQHGIYLAFSIEQLQSSQRKPYRSMGSFTYCLLSKRVRYELWDGTPGPSPTHSSAVVYVPGRANLTGVFVDVFSQFGDISTPTLRQGDA